MVCQTGSRKTIADWLGNLTLVACVVLSLCGRGVESKTVSTSMFKHKDTAKCDLKKADRCTQILYIYGDPDYQMSESFEQAEQFCKYVSYGVRVTTTGHHDPSRWAPLVFALFSLTLPFFFLP